MKRTPIFILLILIFSGVVLAIEPVRTEFNGYTIKMINDLDVRINMTVEYNRFSSWLGTNQNKIIERQIEPNNFETYVDSFSGTVGCGTMFACSIGLIEMTYVAECSPNLVNTSWSTWQNIGSCLISNSLNQNRYTIQFDNNSCGKIENQTIYGFRELACDYFQKIDYCSECYDDFSPGNIDNSKWEIRQDIENQPFMEEYFVDSGNFHTFQNTTGDYRVYLIPKHNFTTGDVIEYDTNLVFKENNYMQMVLLAGDQYKRIGIFGNSSGTQGYNELGKSHIRIEFEENNFRLTRTSPSGLTFMDNLSLSNSNGTYSIYIGSVSGHNGKVHIDYDNFVISKKEGEMEIKNLKTLLDLGNVFGFYIKNDYAKINWKESLNLSSRENWSNYINMSNNYVYINSTIANALNRSARITLNNLSWITPKILKNGIVCGVNEGCTQISYNFTSGEFIFDVVGFSTYTTEETITLPLELPPSSSGGGGGSSKKIIENENETNQALESSDFVTFEENNSQSSTEDNKTKIVSIPITGAIIGGGFFLGMGIGVILIILGAGAMFFIIRKKK